MKASFLAVVITPAPFLFQLHNLCTHISIAAQYLKNVVLCFEMVQIIKINH